VNVTVKFKKLDPKAIVPTYATVGSSGMDVYSLDTIELIPDTLNLFRTGLALELPEGWEIQIRSRSGLASQGVWVANQPGTLDSDYRGELKIMLFHMRGRDLRRRVMITEGERIAQLVFSPVYRATLLEVEELSETERGEKGLGSTGR